VLIAGHAIREAVDVAAVPLNENAIGLAIAGKRALDGAASLSIMVSALGSSGSLDRNLGSRLGSIFGGGLPVGFFAVPDGKDWIALGFFPIKEEAVIAAAEPECRKRRFSLFTSPTRLAR